MVKITKKLRNSKLFTIFISFLSKHSKSGADVKQLKGSVALKMTTDEVERELKKMRAEWDRKF